MLKAKISEDEFENVCRSTASAYLALEGQWRHAMKALLVNSPEYRSLCSAGQRTGFLVNKLVDAAYDRGYSTEQIDELFGEARSHGCSFS